MYISIGKNIKRLRKSNGYTQTELAEKIGVSDRTISAWETDRNEPNIVDIQKLADALHTKKSTLIGEDLDDINIPTIPIYGSISAGLPFEAIQDIWEIACPWLDNKIDTEEMFALKINGDSMDRIIPDGYYAIFQKQDDVKTGEIAAVFINGGDATLKRVLKFSFSKKLILEPLSHNPIHEEQQYGEFDDIRIIGKYVGCISPYGFEIE